MNILIVQAMFWLTCSSCNYHDWPVCGICGNVVLIVSVPFFEVEEFDTESEMGDDRMSVRSFQSQVRIPRSNNLTHTECFQPVGMILLKLKISFVCW